LLAKRIVNGALRTMGTVDEELAVADNGGAGI